MAKINNITSYPISTPVTGSDIVIGSITGSGGDTANFLMSGIANYMTGQISLANVCSVGSTTATTMDIADTLTLSKATGTGLQVDANATIDGILSLTRTGGTGLSVTDGVNIGGGIDCYGLHHQWGALTVEGITTLTGALDANSTADIADTLTLSKATGTGLQVDANAIIDGTLTVTTALQTNRITAPSLANIAFYVGGVQRGAFVAPLGVFALSYGLTVSAGLTTLQDTLVQGGLYTTPDTPASASASGAAGQISVDANYIYVCTATNTWKRVAIATW